MPKTSKLLNDIQYLKTIGPKFAQKFRTLNINTIKDLLYHFPRDCLNRSQVTMINEASIDSQRTIKAKIANMSVNQYYGKRKILNIAVSDKSGNMMIKFFNQIYLKDTFKKDTFYLFTGKVTLFGRFRQMINPLFEEIGSQDENEDFEKILPIYALTAGITQNALRKRVRIALENYLKCIEDPFSEEFLKQNGFIDLQTAIRNIHFPDNESICEKAIKRLVFDELFFLEFNLVLSRKLTEINL